MFWAATAVLVLALLPYFVPVFDDDQLFDWGWLYADIPVAVATLLAVSLGIRKIPSRPERQFWRLVALAYGVALVIEVGNAFVPDTVAPTTVGLLLTSGYLAYYVALTLAAVVSRTGAVGRGTWRLYWIRAVGLGVIAMGFLVYFELVPLQANGFGPQAWYPGLFLYAALDVVLCVVFLTMARDHEDTRWRGLLCGMALVSGLHAVLDSAEAALYLEPLLSAEISPMWDLAWYAPEFAIVVVARLFLAAPAASAIHRVVPVEPRTDRGAMVVGLLALPVLHAGLYYFGVLSPDLRGTREGVVAAFLLVMGLVTFYYLRTLERERERHRRALALSEERYRSFVRARSDEVYRAEATAPISVSAPVDDQLDAIRTGLRIAEASQETLGAMAFVDLIPEGARDRLLRRWIGDEYQAESEVFERDVEGGPRYFRLSLTGIVVDGALVRAWITRSDVTDQRVAALENEHLARQLEQARKMESLGTRAGGIAHDFNNLLVPIMGFSELALMYVGRDEDEVRAGLAQVYKASQVAADLVDQILAVSREQPRREVPFLVQETVRDALALLRPGLPPRIELKASIAESCPPALGDPSRIHQVVMNLCTNAAQAIGLGEGRIHLRVEHDPEVDPEAAPRGWVVLRVDDDGPGMDDALVRRVFDPFFTTKEAGKGTGLGLAVVHGIVMSHGGRVALDSTPGVGTRVTVHIPIAEPPQAPAAIPARLRSEPLSVLVVDDEAPVAAVIRKVLEADGHAVTVASDGPAALALFDDGGRFDVIVTDFAMPRMNGVELADAVLERDADLRVVLSSGYLFHDPVIDDRFVRLKKPFTATQLTSAVDQAFRAR